MAETVSEFTSYDISDGDEVGTAIAIGDLNTNPTIEIIFTGIKDAVLMQLEGSLDGGTTWAPITDYKGRALAWALTRSRTIFESFGPIDGYTHIRPALYTHGNELGTITTVKLN